MGFINSRLTAAPTLPQQSGERHDLRGLIADRPAADEVAVGTTFWAVDRIGELDETSVSTGSAWTNL